MFNWLRKRPHRPHRQMLSEYVDGRLGDAARARLEAHLQACSVCQEELDSLRATVQMLHSLPQVAVPRSFRLQSAPVPLREPRPLLLRPMQLSTAVAALLLAVLVVGDFAGIFPAAAPALLPEVASQRGPEGTQTPAPATTLASDVSQERAAASFDTAEGETTEIVSAPDEKAIAPPSPPRSAVATILLALRLALGAAVAVLAGATGYLTWRRRRRQGA